MPHDPAVHADAVVTDGGSALSGALAALAWDEFPPLAQGGQEFSPEAVQRILEDLRVGDESRVLLVDPISGALPTLLSAVGGFVEVYCPTPSLSGQLAEQLGRAGLQNVHLTTSIPKVGAAERFDAVIVCRSRALVDVDEFLQGLGDDGVAALPLDEHVPPRRLQRVRIRKDGSILEEELDLAAFRPLLGDLLVEAGCVLRQEIAEAVQAAKVSGRRLGEELLRRGSVREDDLFRTLAAQRQLKFTDTARVLERLDPDLVRRLPRKYLDHYGFIPVQLKDGRAVVVSANCDLPVWELGSVFDGAVITAELTSPTDMQRIWTAIELGFVGHRPRQPEQAEAKEPEETRLEDSRAAGLFDAILVDAVAERASDIHLEIFDSGARLRYRIDGCLHDIDRYRILDEDLSAVVNVIKLAANLDIAERRAPQGGRIRRRIGNQLIDFRVQTQPTLLDENVVIRILPQDRRPLVVEELGFPPEAASRYRRLLKEPHGLVLVVGATGSGKSTTLYAGLQQLARDTTRKVITIEDPIEFSLEGIQQTQVNLAVGFHFADAMRAFVREDPDVILVGEIRDTETALETIRAAQTGHLVLATLHCNDAVDAVQRLADLGMHPNSIASELTAVIAQRLARKVCTGCRTAAEPPPEILAELFPHGAPPDFRCFAGAGCDRCNGTGTRGRIAVVELLEVGPDIRRAISRGALTDDLRVLAREAGTVSLRDNALRLVQEGVIPIGELYDVLSAQQMGG